MNNLYHKIPFINNICYIIPSYVLREIIKNGNAKQQRTAFQTLEFSERFRGMRASATLSITEFNEEKIIEVYDAKNGYMLPGILARNNNKSSKDKSVNEAYDGASITYDLFKNVYERNSIDDRGMKMISTVHYGRDYNNAFWDGKQMVYGDGDGDIFERFTKSIDVIAHELTHGITQYEAGLVYWDQPGALNEHMSDVFGSIVKQYLNKETVDKADWLIGEGLFTSKIKGEALRSLKAPGSAYNDPIIGKDPQPAHMKDYVDTDEDNGGVHINSGIPNHAFYLTAMEIGGYSWEKSGLIWYIALRDLLRRRSNFKRAATITYKVAGKLFGNDSKEQKAVKNGWKGVGIEI